VWKQKRKNSETSVENDDIYDLVLGF